MRPAHGQDCRLLLAYDREQAAARTDELLRRLEDHLAESESGPGTRSALMDSAAGSEPAGDGRTGRRPSWARDDEADPDRDATAFRGPYTVVLVDGDPGGAAVREAVARLALEGPRAGIHVVCLAETAPASPASPVTETYEAACAAAPAFRDCGAVALLSGDVATALRLMRVARTGTESGTGSDTSRAAAAPDTPGDPAEHGHTGHGHAGRGSTGHGPVGHGTVAAVDAVSPAWAERFARALAPLRARARAGEAAPGVSAPLPAVGPAAGRVGAGPGHPGVPDGTVGGRGRRHGVSSADGPGRCSVPDRAARVGADLAAEGPHLLIEGPPGSGRTELLRAMAASLAAAERPDRLSVVLLDGRDSGARTARPGEGLRVCTDLPHVTTHLAAYDPVRMREFAQSLSAELKRRAELLGRSDVRGVAPGRRCRAGWSPSAPRGHAARPAPVRAPGPTRGPPPGRGSGREPRPPPAKAPTTWTVRPARPFGCARRRPVNGRRRPRRCPGSWSSSTTSTLLVSPALGAPGRPAAGSVVRALEAVAREGERLGVHLVAAAGVGGRTAASGAGETGHPADQSRRPGLRTGRTGARARPPGRGRTAR